MAKGFEILVVLIRLIALFVIALTFCFGYATVILDKPFNIKDLNPNLCCKCLVLSATVTGYFATMQMADMEIVQKVLTSQGQLLGRQRQALADVTQSVGDLTQQIEQQAQLSQLLAGLNYGAQLRYLIVSPATYSPTPYQ